MTALKVGDTNAHSDPTFWSSLGRCGEDVEVIRSVIADKLLDVGWSPDALGPQSSLDHYLTIIIMAGPSVHEGTFHLDAEELSFITAIGVPYTIKDLPKEPNLYYTLCYSHRGSEG